MSERPRLVVLISGSGSNLQAFIDQSASGELPAEIAAVIANKPDARGLQRAEQAGIPALCVPHTQFPDRESFDAKLAECIDQFAPDLVILAGFMRILTPGFVNRFAGRLLNIHPSLLPKYPGLHTHQRAIDAGDSEAGATVHYVTAELDGGPPVLQARVTVEHGESAETLAAKVLEKEHIIYPLAARWIVEGKLKLTADGPEFNGQPIPADGLNWPL